MSYENLRRKSGGREFMKKTKLKRYAASVLIVLSLLVSSVAACCCAHHEEKTKAETASCHADAHDSSSTKTQADDSAATKSETTSGKKSEIDHNDELNVPCGCSVQPAPKVFAKNENVKIEKQAVTVAVVKLPEAEFAASIVAFESVFAAPFYLSDSFYNLSPGRAPPRR